MNGSTDHPPAGADAAEAPATLSPRAERKCAQLLDGARSVIHAKGLDGASVDDIARAAGMSKATMYRYYPDKTALFAAVMMRDCGLQSGAMRCLQASDRPLDDVLREFAMQHIGFVLSAFAQDSFRTVVAESARFPEVGRAFYESHFDRARQSLAPVLADAAARGVLDLADPDRAAHQFFALCQAEVFYKRLFGIVADYSCAAIVAHARAATDAFLRIYRASASPG